MPRGPSLFRGSELPRLLVLVGHHGRRLGGGVAVRREVRPAPIRPAVVVEDNPQPVVPDRSIEFESVTDRTPMSLRDNAAYARLLERARSKTPAELAREARRDILLTQIWERPELYRGVPIHLEGTVRRSFRYQSKLSKTGWLYEAWIDVPDVRGIAYDCVFEEPPKGFPLGSNISEKVVFNGYFLKIMVYQAAAVNKGAWAMINRGSPVLVGRIVWDPASSAANEVGSGSTLRWTLILLGILIVISALRWVVQLGRLFGRGDRGRRRLSRRRPDRPGDPRGGGPRRRVRGRTTPRPVRTWRRSTNTARRRQAVVRGRRMRHNRRPCPQRAIDRDGTRSPDRRVSIRPPCHQPSASSDASRVPSRRHAPRPWRRASASSTPIPPMTSAR